MIRSDRGIGSYVKCVAYFPRVRASDTCREAGCARFR